MKSGIVQAVQDAQLRRLIVGNGRPAVETAAVPDPLDEALARAQERLAKLRQLIRVQQAIARRERQALGLELGANAGHIRQIIVLTAAWGHITEQQIVSTSRRLECFRPRAIACLLCRELTIATLTAIGQALGGRDHGSILSACQTARNWIDTDPHLRSQVSLLRAKIQSTLAEADGKEAA